jgi:hypothetical protein
MQLLEPIHRRAPNETQHNRKSKWNKDLASEIHDGDYRRQDDKRKHTPSPSGNAVGKSLSGLVHKMVFQVFYEQCNVLKEG